MTSGTKRSPVRTAAIALGVVMVVLVAAAAACGPLLPWSPVHPGYRELRSARARVLYGIGTTLPPAYAQLDGMIAEAERFHGYAAPARITVVVCRSWGDFVRFVPWLRGVRVGAVTLATGDAIFVTPKLDEGGRDHGEFLRHELSHAVLAQNTSVRRTFRLQRHEWAYEGLAVWFGRQQSYVTEQEFLARAHADGVAVHVAAPTPDSQRVDIRYRYIVWRNFYDYLDQSHGHRAVVAFIHAVNHDPTALEQAFAAAFAGSPASEAAAFERAVFDGRYRPDPMPRPLIGRAGDRPEVGDAGPFPQRE